MRLAAACRRARRAPPRRCAMPWIGRRARRPAARSRAGSRKQSLLRIEERVAGRPSRAGVDRRGEAAPGRRRSRRARAPRPRRGSRRTSRRRRRSPRPRPRRAPPRHSARSARRRSCSGSRPRRARLRAGSGRGSRPRTSRERVPAALAARPPPRRLRPRRARPHPRPGGRRRRRTPRASADEDAGAGLAELLGDGVVVRHGRDAEAHVLGGLRGLDPLVLLARVEGDVEVGGVRERLVALEPAEDDDVVSRADPLADAVARPADEPEPGLRRPRGAPRPRARAGGRRCTAPCRRRGPRRSACARTCSRRRPCPAASCSPAARISSGVTVLRLTPCGITWYGFSTPSDSKRRAARSAVTTYAARFGRLSSSTSRSVKNGSSTSETTAGKVGDLRVVGREQRAVAAAGEPHHGRVADGRRPAVGPVLDAAHDALVRAGDEVAVEPVEPREQLGVARVVVALEPDAA